MQATWAALATFLAVTTALAATGRADEPPAAAGTVSGPDASGGDGSTRDPSPPPPPAYSMGTQPAWYLLAGLTAGNTFVARDRGGFLGGEASIVRLGRETQFFGFYADGYHDFGGTRTYATSGLEGGYKLVGIDGGLASRFGERRPELGATGRLFVGIGVVSVYCRYAYFADSLGVSDEHVVQAGVLLKLPAWVWGGS